MDYYYSTNAAELEPLKTELVDLISSCLMKEPPFEAAPPDRPAASTRAPATAGDGAAAVRQMRELVHLISRQDGEFVLKLALYARHALHLRRSPSFLVALCAREPNCLPFLQPYMEKIIVLPSDWLAVANYAYYYDCDAAHDYADARVHDAGDDDAAVADVRAASVAVRGRPTSGSPTPSLATRSPPRDGGRSESRGRHGGGLPSRASKPAATPPKAAAPPPVDPTRPRIPAALRSALVHVFASFSVFSMAKYDNTAAERRAKRRQLRRAGAAANGRASDDSGDDVDSDDSEKEGKPKAAAAAPIRTRPRSFTFKQLIRMLHITEPAYIVCCLLGKRYPATEEDFRRMRLHLTDPTWKAPAPLKLSIAPTIKRVRGKAGKSLPRKQQQQPQGRGNAPSSGDSDADEAGATEAATAMPFCVFDARRAGQRMRLPVPETWETRLSSEGNTGNVWDALVAANAVPYMALLRNLRNVLTRLCTAATHRRLLDKLIDEQQVAASQQMPHRFYSAYVAVRQVESAAAFLDALRETSKEERSMKKDPADARRWRPNREETENRKRELAAAAKLFERPMVPRPHLQRYLKQYTIAIDAAVNTAARLNVVPMQGTTVVVLCITEALFEPITAMGAAGAAAAPASVQRKVDVVALLTAMLLRSCEQCVVLLYCFDEYEVFSEKDLEALKALQRGDLSDGDAADEASLTIPDSEDSTSSDESSEDADPDDAHGSGRGAAAATTNTIPGLMRLVDILTASCAALLARKRLEAGATHIADSFAMFARGAGAQFPYAFLDEVIERRMRVESLFVFDEGVHRTYAGMNRNAPAFGDLPTYLSRLRRTGSPDLVYVGVNVKASTPKPVREPWTRADGQRSVRIVASSPASAGAATGAEEALRKDEVRLRFSHRNDLLLSGFSDAILRLVAERMGGGALSVIERAAETYHVARFCARVSQAALAERAKALRVLAALRDEQQQQQQPVWGRAVSPDSGRPTASPAVGSPKVLSPRQGDPSAAPATSSFTNEARLSAHPSRPAPAVVLPSFDSVTGKIVSETGWGEEWDRSVRSSERRLRWMTSTAGGLTPSETSTGRSKGASSGGYGGDEGAAAAAQGHAALPSIRRLLAKPTLGVATEAADVRADGDEAPGEAEAAWLSSEGKRVSPVFHPQPFISVVKLMSSIAAAGESRHPAELSVPPAMRDTRALREADAAGSGKTSAADTTASTRRSGRHDHAHVHPVSSGGGGRGCAGGAKRPVTAAAVRRLLTSYRVCRFFISSTFLDMNNERNAITLDVFPGLRRWAAEAGLKVTLLEVDLRWGIPGLATTRNLSTSVCLNEVSRCSPFFIGVIGARYGSYPPTPLQLVVDEDVDAEDYAWMSDLNDPRVSVTELEMRHAIFTTQRRLGPDAESSALFFARDSPRLLASFAATDAARRAVYEPDTPAAAAAVARLKQRITASGCRLTTYVAEHVGVSHAAAGAAAGGVTPQELSSRSAVRAMQEDELGQWAVRSRRGLTGPSEGAGGGAHPSAAAAAGVGESGSPLSSTSARIRAGTEEPQRPTSMDVAIDMTDFSSKVFAALQALICRVCEVPCPSGQLAETEQGAAAESQSTSLSSSAATSTDNKPAAHSKQSATTAPAAAAAAATTTAAASPGLYEALVVAQGEFVRKLSALYAAPHGLLEQLARFALNGTLDGAVAEAAADGSGPAQGWRLRTGTPQPAESRTEGTVPRPEGAALSRTGASSAASAPSAPRHSPAGADGGSILLLEGSDGDGKSSALAALMERVLLPMRRGASASESAQRFLFYSTKAGDDSVRGLLLFLAKSFRAVFQLYGEVTVHDTDAVDQLVLVLEQVYATLQRRAESDRGDAALSAAANTVQAQRQRVALVVLLDGLDKSSEAAELLSLLGTVLSPQATQHVRFLVSANPRSPLARALRTRAAAACVLGIPTLAEAERALLVRLHLAHYGKQLEESFATDELKDLLRKGEAGRPSYLVSAITHLRLFSTFDTLRQDIRALPATRAALHVQLFHHLQSRFDAVTCRLVLSLLLLRQPVGGLLEYNLYRLVSNVAVASRLVALLRGICLDAHHGRLVITSSSFVEAIARTFFRFPSDYQAAQERVLLAELCYRPIDVAMDAQEVKAGLRRVAESIQRSAVDPLARRTFVPERYAPRELFGVLQGSAQASRLDVTAALAGYLPFLEGLLVDRRMLSNLIALLSSILAAAVSATSLSAGAPAASASVETCDSVLADGVGATDRSYLASYRMLAVQWRPYAREVRRLSGVLQFLQKHYHILLRQPALLRQCVWNSAGSGAYISTYDAATTARVQQAVLQGSGGGTQDAATGPGESPPPPPPLSVLSSTWVHWLNTRQHGGGSRILLSTASPQPIRCLAMSPDGTEVALGGDDGIVRRVSADEDDQQPQPQQAAANAPSQQQQQQSSPQSGTRDAPRRRVASVLRHDAAVTAVLYVTPRPSTSASGLGGAFGSPDAAAAGPQLLVSGCARGTLYVWNLEDNSLLRKGVGHTRAISGLACHPLEPQVLLSSSHDSLVRLWEVSTNANASSGSGGGSGRTGTSRLRAEVEAALALRMPKHPAGSAARLRQERQLHGLASGGPRDGREGAGSASGRGQAAQRAQRSTGAAGGRGSRRGALQAAPLQPFHTERQHHTPVGAIAFHRSGDVFASGSWDGFLILHNVRDLRSPPPVIPAELRVPATPPKPRFTRTAAAAAAAPQTWCERRGPEHRKVAFQTTAFALGSPVRALCFTSSLAVTCVAGCHSGAVVVVDAASAAVVARWTSLHVAPVTRLALSLDGRCIASADEHGVVRLTHTGITGSVFATVNGHHGAVAGLCFRPPRAEWDGGGGSGLGEPPTVLLTGGEDCTLQAWRVDSSSGSGGINPAAASTGTARQRQRRSVAAHFTEVTAVAASSDGRLLVTGAADGVAIVYQAAEDGEMDDGDAEHAAGVWTRAAFATGAATRATPSSRAHTGPTRPLKPSFALHHDDCRITCVRFALRDSRIVVGVVFGLVYVWSSAPGLNRVEGRLLLRVRVPEHGLYPVVSLGVVEQRTGGGSGGAATGKAASGHLLGVAPHRRGSHHTAVKERSDAARLLTTAGTDRDVSDADDLSSALITAVCANGDVAVLKLFSDATSLVMTADQTRRRRQRRQRDASLSSCHLLLSLSAREASGSIASSGEVDAFANAVAGTAKVQRDAPQTGGSGADVAGADAQEPVMYAAADGTVSPWSPRSPVKGTAVAGGCGSLLLPVVPLTPRHADANSGTQRPRRGTLDRRAARLQRLLVRSRAAEQELRQSYELPLHRHRLQWANTVEAEEIVGLVWLSTPTSPLPAPSHPGADSALSASPANTVAGVDVTHRRLALVVAQAQLFLLFSDGHESAVSGRLQLRVAQSAPDDAARLAAPPMMPEGGMHIGAPEGGRDSGDSCDDSDERVAAAHVTDNASSAATADEEMHFAVSLEHVLREAEYFTSASVAVAVAVAPGAAPAAEPTRAFAVAVTTSLGEVLLLRVEVPFVHGRGPGPSGHTPAPARQHGVDGAGGGIAAQLGDIILPRTNLTLCRRLTFAGAATAHGSPNGSHAAAGTATGSALQHIPTTPQATSVQLSTCASSMQAAAHPNLTDPPAAVAPVVPERVVVIAGCADGSTRVWLTSTSLSLPRRVAGDVPLGCFFGGSAVGVVSALLHTTTSGATALSVTTRWVAGDTLGNVFQLQLERDAPGCGGADGLAAALDRRSGSNVAGGASAGAGLAGLMTAAAPQPRPWVRSLQQLVALMHDPPPAATVRVVLASGVLEEEGRAAPTAVRGGGGALAPRDGSDVVDASHAWPGWSSLSPADWLTPVDVSPSPSSMLLLRSRHAAQPRHDAQGVRPPKPALPSLSLSSTAAPHADAAGGLPPVQWSILPELPALRRSTNGFPAESGSTAPRDDGALGDGGAGRPASAAAVVLPSFGVARREGGAAWQMPPSTQDGGEVPVEASFRVPLTDLLTAYRQGPITGGMEIDPFSRAPAMAAHPTADGGAADEAGAASSTKVRFAIPAEKDTEAGPRCDAAASAPSASSSQIPPPLPYSGAAAAGAGCPATARTSAEAESEEEEEEDFFAVLYEAHPPAASAAPERRAWLLHQQEVLKEAMRVQRYNKQARHALKAYQRRVTSVVQLA